MPAARRKVASAADVEAALLTKLCTDETWSHIVKCKVSPKHFVNIDHRTMFSWIADQYAKYDEVPSLDVLMAEFPEFVPEYSKSSQRLLIERVRDRKIYADVAKHVQDIVAESREDPRKGLQRMQEAANAMASEGVLEDEAVTTDGVDCVLEFYEKAKLHKGITGVPWPWPALTEMTGGVDNGAFIGIYGPSGTMKTWILLYIATWMQVEYGKRVLFFTYEMTKEQILNRYIAIRAGVDWKRFRMGTLSGEDEFKLKEKAYATDKDECPLIVVEQLEVGPSALNLIKSKAKDHSADVIMVDGLSFLCQDLDWKSFGAVTLGLRTISRNTKIPIIATHHSNRSRKKVDKSSSDATDVALGDTLERYCTLLLRIVRESRQEDNDEIVITTPKSRDSARKIITINALPARDFSEKYSGDANKLAELGIDVDSSEEL